MKFNAKSLFSLCVLGGVFCISAAYSQTAATGQKTRQAPVAARPRLSAPKPQGSAPVRAEVGRTFDLKQRQLGAGQTSSFPTAITGISKSYLANGVFRSGATFRFSTGQDLSAFLDTDEGGFSAFSVDSAAGDLFVGADDLGVRSVRVLDANGSVCEAQAVAFGVFEVSIDAQGQHTSGVLVLTPYGFTFKAADGSEWISFGNEFYLRGMDGVFVKLYPKAEAAQTRAVNAEECAAMYTALAGTSDLGAQGIAMVEAVGVFTGLIDGISQRPQTYK